MRVKRLSIRLMATLATFTVALFAIGTWAFAQETVLHNFDNNGTDGAYPYAGLVFDTAGNLYGTTYAGGSYGVGTVFELTPNGSGGWTEKVLHSFGSGTDGGNPRAGLIFDAAKSNLYGTTPAGGTHTFGTVFELSPNGSGGWTERVLYSFCSQTSCTDGETPQAGLIFDAAGNLYSTTYQGGTYSGGTAFELSPQAGGGWTEQVLHSFGNGVEGIYPYASLVFDTAGNLYGTTYTGGENNGTVFELTPTTGGGWTEQTLTNFLGSYGLYLSAGLIIDVADNLYGTTPEGGSSRNCGTTACGTVFELSPNGSGGWTEQSLHNFDNNGTDGAHPYDSLKFDSAGNLYGTTYAGGSYGVGMVFELTPQAGRCCTENVLHSFISNGTDGAYPYAGLIFDTVGNLYGTTYYGGTYGGGTVFELTRQLVATTTALTTAPNPSKLGPAGTE